MNETQLSNGQTCDKNDLVLHQLLSAYESTCNIIGPAAEEVSIKAFRTFLANNLQAVLREQVKKIGILYH